MGLLNTTGGIQDRIRNPFQKSVDVPFDGNDFPDGFLIEEILDNGDIGDKIRLFGNQMPKVPFTFGGSQRVKKEYYSGFSEPTIQVMGGEEDDITIVGTLKDKRKDPVTKDKRFKNISTEIQQLLDGIRLRGNLVRIAMGEFERYCILQKTKWDLKMLSNLDYSITFSIIGFNAPKNAQFLEQTREVPFAINKELINQAQALQESARLYPTSVPLSIGDAIGQLTNVVAGVISAVTGFVDQIISTVNDIQKSITRVKGLIKHAQNKLREYKNFIGSIRPFDSAQALTGKYTASKYYSSLLSMSSVMTALLERMKKQLNGLGNTLPLGRHLVVSGDTLQKISNKFYGFGDNWKKIYDFNKLTTTDLVTGKILEIPRV